MMMIGEHAIDTFILCTMARAIALGSCRIGAEGFANVEIGFLVRIQCLQGPKRSPR